MPAVRSPRRGATLVEVLVAAVLAGVVVASLQAVLLGSQRFYRAQPQILDVQRNVRAVTQFLPAELRGLDAGDGDIVAMSDTAITIKAPRALGIVCGAPEVAASRVTVGDGFLSGYRAIDPARDSVLLFRDGDTLEEADDRWLRARVAAVGASPCPDGSAGTRLALVVTDGAAELAGVAPGAPLRTFEVVRYRLYEDGSHTWWLGVQSYGGGWSTTSPLAGPLRPRDGLRLAYLDAAGAETGLRTAVRQVLLTVRGRSVRRIETAGRRAGPYLDSLSTRVFLRNSARP
jgi:hypothetical protein